MGVDSTGAARRPKAKAAAAPINSPMNAIYLRRVIDAAVIDLGHTPTGCKETVLIREGYFVGRQFRYDGVRAIWFAEEEVVKFYGDDCRVLGTMRVAEEAAAMRCAA